MRFLLSGLMLVVFVFPGCARYQSFRVLDAQTGRPMDGVPSERLEGSLRLSPMPLVLLDSLSPVERQSSDSSGDVKFDKTGRKFAFNPKSGYPGFDRAYVSTTWSGAKIVYPEEMREVHVKPINGVVEVPLHRMESESAASDRKSSARRLSIDTSSSLPRFERSLR